MTGPKLPLVVLVLGAIFAFGACGGAPAPATSAGASAPSASSGPTDGPGPTVPPGLPTPSAAPATDLSSLAGDWIASIEDAHLNYATGTYAGGVITVAGAKINLKATHANGGFASVNAAGRIGPTPISNCSATSCEAPMTDFFPALIKVLDDGTIALVGMADFAQFNAGAGTCDAPTVAGAGVVKIAPDGNMLSVVVGTAGGEGIGSGTDPCAGGAYQIVWTQVLTRAP